MEGNFQTNPESHCCSQTWGRYKIWMEKSQEDLGAGKSSMAL
jgi:hypothetical protein